MTNETWRDIPGYNGEYQASTLGHIRNKSFTLKASLIRNGYLVVRIQYGGVRKNILAHRLIALTFIPNIEHKPCVNHKDCNKQNNSVKNLEWCTYKENMEHATKNNLMASGQRNHMTKLTTEDVLKIHELRKSGMRYKSIAKEYDVAPETISNIVRGKTWSNIQRV